jgi:hypothetical protein
MAALATFEGSADGWLVVDGTTDCAAAEPVNERRETAHRLQLTLTLA